MLLLSALILLGVIPLAHGLLFAKFGAVRRTSIISNPHGHAQRSIVARCQHQADEAPLDSDTVNQTTNDVQAHVNSVQHTEVQEPEAPSIDPVTQAIADYDKVLTEELQHLEVTLRSERASLTKVRDKMSESGKNGFFIVQAQVNDFTRRKDKEQKERIVRNKREFVEKMLPVVDAFRSAPVVAPANTEKEENMHKSYGSLLGNILTVFGKYGYSEFTAGERVDCTEPGDVLNPQLYQVSEVRDCSGEEPSASSPIEEGSILETVRAGMRDSDGGVLRKASVVVCGRVHGDVASGEPSGKDGVDVIAGSSTAESNQQEYNYEHHDYEDDE